MWNFTCNFFFSDLWPVRSQFRASRLEPGGVNPNPAAGIIWLICPWSAHEVAQNLALRGGIGAISRKATLQLRPFGWPSGCGWVISLGCSADVRQEVLNEQRLSKCQQFWKFTAEAIDRITITANSLCRRSGCSCGHLALNIRSNIQKYSYKPSNSKYLYQ